MENCKSVEELKKEISEYDSFVADTVCDLEKVNFILNNLLNEYNWRYEPTAEKGIKSR